MTNTNNASNGVGFCSLLAIVFIVLKLTGTIGWSWWWVLAPLWVSFALAMIILFIFIIVMALRKDK